MARSFTVEIITPERLLFSSERVVSLIAPGWEGSFGVMAFHSPMVVALQTGVITLKLINDEEINIAVVGGFLEVSKNRVVILCDIAELDKKIDVERAKRALQRALGRLKNFTDPTIDRERAHQAKQRALARLKAAGAL